MMTLRRAADLFLSEYKPTTRTSYAQTIDMFVDFTGGAKPLTVIGHEHVLEFMNYVDQRGASNGYYNKHIKTLRTFFNRCLAFDWLKRSPAAGIRYRTQPRIIDREKAMPDNLYAQLVDHVAAMERVSKANSRAMALMLFLGDTGCRIGGATGLQWTDVNFTDRSATVTEKGDITRTVFFGNECAQALRRWRLNQPQHRGIFVFSRDGGTITTPNLGQYFRRLCLSAGIGSWGPHSLRFRKGFQMNDAGVSPSVGANVLGNSVKIYLEHYSPKDTKRMRETVDNHAWTGAPVASKIRRFGSN